MLDNADADADDGNDAPKGGGKNQDIGGRCRPYRSTISIVIRGHVDGNSLGFGTGASSWNTFDLANDSTVNQDAELFFFFDLNNQLQISTIS